MTRFTCPWCGAENDYLDPWREDLRRNRINEGQIEKMDCDEIRCRCPSCKGGFVAEPKDFTVGMTYRFAPFDPKDPDNCEWYPEDYDMEALRKEYYVQENGHQPPAKKLFSLNRRKRCKSRSR